MKPIITIDMAKFSTIQTFNFHSLLRIFRIYSLLNNLSTYFIFTFILLTTHFIFQGITIIIIFV